MTYDKAWMSAIWGRFGSFVWAALSLAGITIAGQQQQEIMSQGTTLIQSGWAFAGQAGSLIAMILSIVSKVREMRKVKGN